MTSLFTESEIVGMFEELEAAMQDAKTTPARKRIYERMQQVYTSATEVLSKF